MSAALGLVKVAPRKQRFLYAFRRWQHFAFRLLGVLVCLGGAGRGIAGGGGENMLLVVNPNDPASLQIANAYAALRDIPSNNILFLAPPSDYRNDGQPISQAEVYSYYLSPIANAITSRGLTNQVDYIGSIGQATCYSITPQFFTSSTTANSLNYALGLLTPLTNGSGLTLQGATYKYLSGPASGLFQNPATLPVGGNSAIHHSASYSVAYPVAGNTVATNYYMSGTIGYTGTNGNTVQEVVASLQNAAAADGTYPNGSVYFEDSSDPRATMRSSQWSTTAAQLAARSISGQLESNTPGATPLNRANVLGAACGAATLTLNNGSTYLPGTWADNVTSFGCDFPDTSQTKATKFIASGAAGTTGSVIEPYSIAARFTNTSIYTFIADGSTLGEAFAKAVASPDVQMPLGDMLAQPSADVPTVAITCTAGNYAAARGTISIGASAALNNPRIATGIGKLQLLIDGVVSSAGALTGNRGSFNFDTTGLSDGIHEVRVVAINNSQAASEGCAVMPILVNNHARSINFGGGNLTLSGSPAAIGLIASAGDGSVSQLELTCLGRVVAQAAGAPGSLSLSSTALAPGDNAIVPVAVFSDGSQVAGGAFTVHVESGAANSWSNAAGTRLWSNPANWSGGTLPQNGDGVARFTAAAYPLAGGGQTVALDASASVEEIDFDNGGGAAAGYTILAAGGQALNLSTSNGPMSQCLINVLSGSHTISAPVTLSAAGNLVAISGAADFLNISGNISGIGGLTKTGSGKLTLTGSGSYTGATIVAAGTLQVGNGGSGASIAGSSGVSDDGSLIFNHSDAMAFSRPITGRGTVTKDGTGILTLTGSDTYTGGTFLNGGTLIAASASALPDGGDLTIGVGAASLFPSDLGTLAKSSPEPLSVPEPSTVGLLGVLAACFLAARILERRLKTPTHALR
jgi:autotransporter-associated beta strand protein